MNNKKIRRSTLFSFCFLFLALLITGLFGISNVMNGGSDLLYNQVINYGLRASIGYYFQLWRPGTFPHETAYIGLVLLYIAVLATVALIILAIFKKKYFLIIPSLLFGAAVAYLPFLLILVVPMVQLGHMAALPMIFMCAVTVLTLFAIFFACLAISELLKDAINALKRAGGDNGEEEFEERPVAEGLSERQVRAIVEKYLAEHVDELHSEEEPAPAPAKEEEPEPEPEPEEEPEEEEEEEEAPAEENATNDLGFNGKRRRASFETRLKNSEFDIRHKYYDLRDYIKWYGLRNRISIPGDTFSYKRQRYVFVTIVGKHIRVYINLNPDDYADSTIPVEKAEAKKYEDLPCMLRVKSDLAYRRAKKLVDDLMEKIGIERPEGDEPKETQEKQSSLKLKNKPLASASGFLFINKKDTQQCT